MASSSKSSGPYEVFLSFRGPDVRNSFASHLYSALVQKGIHTFQDDEELRKGENISMLLKAIEESRIAIILFSENYTFSWWCLEEVAKIMECKKQKGLTVLPVFYKVDPKEVRGGRASYARGLAKHESKHGKDSEETKRWKEALHDAGSLSGWTLNDRDEAKLIQEIVENIDTSLARTPLQVAKHPVGIDSRVATLKSMLNLESDYGVLMVGLWGQGGIGKTSLAKALYNAIFRQFEGSCFLANVREISKESRGLVTLQETLLKDILAPQRRLEVSNVDVGGHLIQRRLGRKKVLLILDDVDDFRQLNALAGESNWFGNGSMIIVTTRDEHLLTYHGIDQDHVYEVKALDGNEAHELLRKHAFQVDQIRTELMDSALNYAKGLPLALEVLGSSLCGAGEDVWKSTLKKLSKNPDKTINDVLIVSFDRLDENEKDLFLHIACFFKGFEKEYIKKVLDSCDLETVVGFDILIKRSLIRIEYGCVQVHDLIQAMGMNIVNEECRDDPAKRSRLWSYDDITDVLSRDVGDCAVKSIVLKPPEPTEIYIDPNALKKMRRLRLLILRNVRDSFQGSIYLPNELSWFEWLECAGRIPEFSSPKKLVGLKMGGCNVAGVVKQLKGFQSLRYINFSGCQSLVCTPDISCTPNLEELDLHNCKNLIEAHESITYHDKLQVLNLRECSELSVFPNVLKSKNLRALHLEKCPKFERFPNIPHELKGLETIYLRETSIKGLPASIENLVSLKVMHLYMCKNLVSVPPSIYKLQKLEKLHLRCCPNLIEFPRYKDSADVFMKTGLSNLDVLDLAGCTLSDTEFLDNPSCFPILRGLILSANYITSLPASINKRDRLFFLFVENCHQLQEIPKLPPFFNHLEAAGCESLQNLGDLTSDHDFLHRALNMDNLYSYGVDPVYGITLIGGEMPEWILPVEGDSISFKVSKDLYDKFLGFALFVSYGNDEKKGKHEYVVLPRVNGECSLSDGFEHFAEGTSFECFCEGDQFELQYLKASRWWGEVDFSRIDGSPAELRLEVRGETVKKWGIRIICKQLDDDLRVVLQDNRLIDPALIYEVGHESTDSEAESSLMYKDSYIEIDTQKNLEDCLMSTEEHSQIGSKRNQNLILPRGKKPRQC